MLTLEIELLTGVYRAGLPDANAAEWPPHPERVFSALVQAWGDGGCDAGEREALEWLEQQKAPQIEADQVISERDVVTVYVPPNDVCEMPDDRGRQARIFRTAVPENPQVRMNWLTVCPSARNRAALDALAHRVASLGHSSSLVRFLFTDDAPLDPERAWLNADDGDTSLRVPHAGRLKKLSMWLANSERPRTGASARYRSPGRTMTALPQKSMFGEAAQWFVFEDTGGFRPDVLAFAQVAKRVRDCLMSLSPQPVPEILSGHAADGTATTRPHIAVVPLANVGWEHATGDLLGFAVVLPRKCETTERRFVLEALARLAHMEKGEQAYAEVHLGEAGSWRLEHVASPARASLKPDRWCAIARTWASMTPVLLDRFPDHGDAIEEARLISAACRNIGLPEPVEIEIHKHSAVRGGYSAYASRGNRQMPDWSFPLGAKFVRRPRRHVVLRFTDKVEGPVILGAGRFHGLGLCLPLDADRTR